MIINFSVENFGSIKDKQTLSFLANKSDHLEEYYIIEPIKGLRLNKLALIYGANASGKTTVLKALDFLKEISTNPFDRKTEIFDFEPFLFNENTPKQNTKFELEFVQNKIRYFYEVELNKNCIVKEKLLNYNPGKAVVFERITDEAKELTSIKFGSKIEIKKSLENIIEIQTLWNNTVIGALLKTNVDITALTDVSDWFNSFTNFFNVNSDSKDFFTTQIDLNRIEKNIIIAFLKRADFNICDLEINRKEDSEFRQFLLKSIRESKNNDDKKKYLDLLDSEMVFNRQLFFYHKINHKNFRLSINQESQGTQRYFEYAGLLAILLRQNTFLPIDELESSLHPDLFNHFLLTYLVNGKKESQLIATTHNREILNNRDLFRDDAIWFTDKDESSTTQLYSLADFDTSVIRDTSNVLNAYKAGKLGGVPNLGDYYIDLEDEG
ncbi:ATP-binding protein [Elizabethkingia meningoseptica]|uniref:ATP-binding protein n=1 Tax=Elizabethkingia meningoseptica TaxID=238 RepID=A0A1V3U4P9_ELIME|nr:MULTISPECIES: ATP-binding protein [Elizabethkingia]AQX11294.1 ATP-binding protein [Elizabethkingia meningoseptica]MBG0512638.1 ATP-binding protein [Elizabethkingia meningoseptica]MDE5435240.1 ATP-binding protein [Elizabethkingia meningoseptica]MDE5450413.1 ATP-binding protein [Elizabethkingia meningoseptica]MDE5472120.1 ATP-binding protein [Elizabethkingia meningoseptica]